MRPLRLTVTALSLTAACAVVTAPAALAGGGGGGSICDGFATGDSLVMHDSCFAGTAQLVDPDTATMTVRNDGMMPHTITATDDSFDLYVPAGDSVTLDLPDRDLIPVYCTLHGTATGAGMAGVIVRTTGDLEGAVAPAAAGEAAAGDGLGSTADLATIGGQSSDEGGDGIAVEAEMWEGGIRSAGCRTGKGRYGQQGQGRSEHQDPRCEDCEGEAPGETGEEDQEGLHRPGGLIRPLLD